MSQRRLQQFLKKWETEGRAMPELPQELMEVLKEANQQFQDLEQEKKSLEKSLATEQEKAYDQFYRLNTFLESTDSVHYILYKNHPEKNFFTSRWPLLFGFNPTNFCDPLTERQKWILASSQVAYREAMQKLDFNGQTTIKYQVENAKNHKQLWLEEEIKKKYDPFLEDEVLTGRIQDISGVEYYREYILESEKRFKRVTDALPVMVWVSDQNHIVTYTNDKTKEFFGVSLEDMKGQFDFAPLVHPDHRKKAIQEWGKKLQRQEPIDDVFMVKSADGLYHYLHEVAVPRFLDSGKFVGYIGAYFDQTKEYQYQKELEADKQQFDLIAMNSSDVTVITNWKGVISYISPGVYRLLGYQPEEMNGGNLYDHIGAGYQRSIQTQLSKKEFPPAAIKNLSFQLVRKNQELLWVETAAQVVEAPTDKHQNLIFHIRDVHEQQLAKQALQSSEEKFRTLFENMDLGVLEVDNEDRILYANQAFEKISGYTLAEMQGQVAAQLFLSKPEDVKMVKSQKRIREKGKESVYEVNIIRKSGEVANMIISGAPVIDWSGKIRGSVGIHWDVTRIRSMERQLIEDRINQEKYILEAKLQAEEDQRSQIGRDLHDGVGQMLAYMSLLLNMMKEKAAYDPEDIDRLGKTVAQTLEQVRTLARTLAPPAIRDLGLRDSVVELIDSYGILTRPVFKLKVYPQSDDKRINLDKKIVVFRVLQELLNNTFKYANADTIFIHLYFQNGFFHLDYRDDGKGFDINNIKKGVGLDSMRSRIAFYKGSIEIQSTPGKGTETIIQLPID